MLTGEEREPAVRPPPVLAVVMPAPEVTARAPQQRRRYILKQDVARYGPTPGREAGVALTRGAQRVTKPHSDECRAHMDDLMQLDEDALVQQRLHADRLRRRSTVAGSSGDERRNPDAEAVGLGLQEATEMHTESEAHKSPREEQKRQGALGHPEPKGQMNLWEQRPKMPM